MRSDSRVLHAAQVQSGGYPFHALCTPFHRQGRLPPQPGRQGQLGRITLVPPFQFRFCPPQPRQLLGNDPFGLAFRRLPSDPTLVVFPTRPVIRVNIRRRNSWLPKHHPRRTGAHSAPSPSCPRRRLEREGGSLGEICAGDLGGYGQMDGPNPPRSRERQLALIPSASANAIPRTPLSRQPPPLSRT